MFGCERQKENLVKSNEMGEIGEGLTSVTGIADRAGGDLDTMGHQTRRLMRRVSKKW